MQTIETKSNEAQPGRLANGHFTKGSVHNPSGRQAIFSYDALQRITSDFLNEYSIGDLIALRKDAKSFKKLTTARAMVLDRIVNSLGPMGGQDFDRIFDRVIGKAKQTVDVNQQIGIVAIVMETVKAISSQPASQANPPLIEAEPVAIEEPSK